MAWLTIIIHRLVCVDDDRVALGGVDCQLVDHHRLSFDTVSFDDSHIVAINGECEAVKQTMNKQT